MKSNGSQRPIYFHCAEDMVLRTRTLWHWNVGRLKAYIYSKACSLSIEPRSTSFSSGVLRRHGLFYYIRPPSATFLPCIVRRPSHPSLQAPSAPGPTRATSRWEAFRSSVPPCLAYIHKVGHHLRRNYVVHSTRAPHSRTQFPQGGERPVG